MGPEKHKFKCHRCFAATLKCGSKETPRKVPILLIEPLKTEMEVIKKIEESRDWRYPIVEEIKPNRTIRLCIIITKRNAVTKRK